MGGRKGAPRNSDDQEDELINLTLDVVKKQLESGKVSSQVLTHFLKRSTAKERLEQEILEEQKKLIRAKTENLESMANTENLYGEAMNAFRQYSNTKDE